jgi:DNA repair protein RadC
LFLEFLMTLSSSSCLTPACRLSLVTHYTRPELVQQALDLLECDMHEADALASPAVVRDYLRLLLGDRPYEVFAVVFLDAQHRVLDAIEMFRGTLTQTSVYPREVVIEALARNAAAVILTHNHPSGHPEPSRADEALTQTHKSALALVDVRVIDHFGSPAAPWSALRSVGCCRACQRTCVHQSNLALPFCFLPHLTFILLHSFKGISNGTST